MNKKPETADEERKVAEIVEVKNSCVICNSMALPLWKRNNCSLEGSFEYLKGIFSTVREDFSFFLCRVHDKSQMPNSFCAHK